MASIEGFPSAATCPHDRILKKQVIGSRGIVTDMDDGLVVGLAGIGFETTSEKMERPAARLRPTEYLEAKEKPRCSNKRHNIMFLLKVYIIII